MLNYEDFEEKTVTRKAIFKGHIIDVFLDEVRLPDGKTANRELVFHPGGVAVIPITSDNKLVLVKQFRKPLEQVTLEIPAGKIDPGEENTPQETAVRELEEETHFRAQALIPVTSMYVSPGFTNEILHIYYAQDLEQVTNPRPQDEDEVLELYHLTLGEAKAEIAAGTICDAKTIFAVQYWELQQVKRPYKEDNA